MKLSVLAIDPGVTTGFTRYQVDSHDLRGLGVADAFRAGVSEQHQDGVRADKFNDWVRELDWANSVAASGVLWWGNKGHLHLVFEDFILRREGTAQRYTLSPVRLTAYLTAAFSYHVANASLRLSERAGALPPGRERVLAHRRARSMADRFHVHAQTPAQAKGFATDQRLKDWDLWIPGQRHARDSLRHLLLWLHACPYR